MDSPLRDELLAAQRVYEKWANMAEEARQVRNELIARALDDRVSQGEIARITGLSKTRMHQLVRDQVPKVGAR
jgi:hypothetical protein